MHSFSSYLKSLPIRYRAILAIMVIITLGFQRIAISGDIDVLVADNRNFVNLLFADENGYSKVYKHSELSGFTTFRGVFIGVKGSLERNLLMKRQLRGTSAPRIEFIELDEPYLQKYEALAHSVSVINAQFLEAAKRNTPLEEIINIDINFFWLNNNDAISFEKIFKIWSERFQVQDFVISKKCKVTRFIENFEIKRTIVTQNDEISQSESILCASAALMIHYGFSNLNYILNEIDILVKSDLTKRYLFNVEISKFFSKLYVRDNPALLVKAGMTQAEVINLLQQ